MKTNMLSYLQSTPTYDAEESGKVFSMGRINV